ncbi:MAG: hypothetical protein R3D88_00505 [Alphaproteobacteria bacterium]
MLQRLSYEGERPAESCLRSYFDAAYSDLRKIVGDSHKLGFSNPELTSILYVYGGGKTIRNTHVEKYCTELGLLTENKELTFLGQKMLRFLHNTSTGEPYIWTKEMADHQKVAAILKPVVFDI